MAGDEPSLKMRQQLGRLLRDARAQKGLSLRAAAKAANVDRGTWTGAEEATRLPQKHKAAAMEAVVGWAPRSFEEILAGGEPTPIEEAGLPMDETSRSRRATILAATPEQLVEMVQLVEEVLGREQAAEFLRGALELREQHRRH